MLPTVDPNADAFMRRILSAPADPLPRLVFADWLEETGTSSNVAWAYFIRAQAELVTLEPNEVQAQALRSFTETLRERIRARLKIPVDTFLRDIPSLPATASRKPPGPA